MTRTKPIVEQDKNAAKDRIASRVLEFGCAEPAEMAEAMLVSLRLHTDAWDLAEDLTRDETGIVVLDVRPKKAYEEAHIPGAQSFPHRDMTESSTRTLDRSKVYVVYCDGIGCNGSTKGAYKLSSLGFRTKELLGGLDWWRRDGHAVLSGSDPGDIHRAKKLAIRHV
jgi:rhodanese-related sulfurtransferase